MNKFLKMKLLFNHKKIIIQLKITNNFLKILIMNSDINCILKLKIFYITYLYSSLTSKSLIVAIPSLSPCVIIFISLTVPAKGPAIDIHYLMYVFFQSML